MNGFLISTRQKNNVRIFGVRCLRQSDKRTNGYKERNGENTLSKLGLCEGGSFSPTIFNSDIELRVSVFIYPFVRLSLCRGQPMPKVRTLFCLVNYLKSVHF